MARPNAADFPRPRPAVRETVEFICLEVIPFETKLRRALSWSVVAHNLVRGPMTGVSFSSFFREVSSACAAVILELGPALGLATMSFPAEMGRTFNSSSKTRQAGLPPNERMKRSLNRGCTEEWFSVRYREWTSYCEQASDIQPLRI